MKEKISSFVKSLGVEDVGFAAAEDYKSPNSPPLETIFPGVKSLVVLAFRELSYCESENMQIAMGGRLDLMDFLRSSNYRVGRYLENEFDAKAMTIPLAYPLEMSYKTKGTVGDVSLRHAAVAAGLGSFGRHSLVIHPKMGSRVIFSAVLTDLEFSSDPPVLDRFCNDCNICVEKCPVGALNEEGKTDVMRCIRNCQPYGLGSQVSFWSKFAEGTTEEQKKMVKDVHFWRLYHAGLVGFQYFCFKCLASCPIAQK